MLSNGGWSINGCGGFAVKMMKVEGDCGWPKWKGGDVSFDGEMRVLCEGFS